MTKVLLTKETFDELLDIAVPACCNAYVVSLEETLLVDEIGEVEVMAFTKLLIAPKAPIKDPDACPDCGDVGPIGTCPCWGPRQDEDGNCVDDCCN